MNLSNYMDDLVVICRRHNVAIKHYRFWRVRMMLATWLFHVAALVAGMRFETEEDAAEEQAAQ